MSQNNTPFKVDNLKTPDVYIKKMPGINYGNLHTPMSQVFPMLGSQQSSTPQNAPVTQPAAPIAPVQQPQKKVIFSKKTPTIPTYTFPNPSQQRPTQATPQGGSTVQLGTQTFPTLANTDLSHMTSAELNDTANNIKSKYETANNKLASNVDEVTLPHLTGQQGVITNQENVELGRVNDVLTAQKEKEAQDKAYKLELMKIHALKGTGNGSSSNGLNISPAAQSYVNQINAGQIKLTDLPSLIPGVAGTTLRNEINMAIDSQRGHLSEQGQRQIDEQLKLVQDLKNNTSGGKHSAVGGSLAKLIPFGKKLGLQPNRVGYEIKAQQLAGILTLDNLGLLKGPLSDADREFIQAVSSGLNLGMSETQYDTQLKSIESKLQAKQTGFNNGGFIVQTPDGSSHSFPSQAAADAFKVAAGL